MPQTMEEHFQELEDSDSDTDSSTSSDSEETPDIHEVFMTFGAFQSQYFQVFIAS